MENNMDYSQLDRMVREVVNRHRRILETRLNRSGLFRAQHMLLVYVSNHAGCSQKQIADAFGISAACVGVSLRKMERSGFIRRQTSPKDNRYYCVEATEKGRELVEYSHQVFEETLQKMYQGINQQQKEQLTEIFSVLQKNLNGIEAELDEM